MTQTIRRKNCKTRREWADKLADAQTCPQCVEQYGMGDNGDIVHAPSVARLLRKEHARAVRIVKRLAVKAEQASKKQRVQDFRDNGSPAKKYTDADLLDSAALLMRSLLVSLQKGRA